MTTANKITIARILMIPLFVMMAIYYGRGVQTGHPRNWQRITAVFVFLLASASDGLDGYVARRYNQRSRLGVEIGETLGRPARRGQIVDLRRMKRLAARERVERGRE